MPTGDNPFINDDAVSNNNGQNNKNNSTPSPLERFWAKFEAINKINYFDEDNRRQWVKDFNENYQPTSDLNGAFFIQRKSSTPIDSLIFQQAQLTFDQIMGKGHYTTSRKTYIETETPVYTPTKEGLKKLLSDEYLSDEYLSKSERSKQNNDIHSSEIKIEQTPKTPIKKIELQPDSSSPPRANNNNSPSPKSNVGKPESVSPIQRNNNNNNYSPNINNQNRIFSPKNVSSKENNDSAITVMMFSKAYKQAYDKKFFTLLDPAWHEKLSFNSVTMQDIEEYVEKNPRSLTALVLHRLKNRKLIKAFNEEFLSDYKDHTLFVGPFSKQWHKENDWFLSDIEKYARDNPDSRTATALKKAKERVYVSDNIRRIEPNERQNNNSNRRDIF